MFKKLRIPKKFILANFVIFTLTSLIFCDAAKLLTWEDCVSLAIKNNPDLSIAKQNLEISRLNYNLSWNNYFPSLSFKYGYSKTDVSTNVSNDWSFGASASQTLFDLQKNSEIKIKKLTFERSLIESNQASAVVRYSLKLAFLRMQFISENIELLKNICDMRAKSSDIVRLQYEGGKESKGNMLQAIAQKNSAQVDLKNAERDLISAKKVLLENLGLSNGDFSVNGKLKKIEVQKSKNIDEEAKNIPKILNERLSLEIAESQVFYEKSNFYPNLKASGNWSLNDNDPSLSPGRESWNVGIFATYSIFDGGITKLKNNISIAKSRLELQKENLKKAELNAKSELQNLQNELEKNYDNVEMIKSFLEAAIQRQKEANIKYLAGRMEFQVWQDIEQNLVNYQLSYLSAIYKLNALLAEKENLLGIKLEEKI